MGVDGDAHGDSCCCLPRQGQPNRRLAIQNRFFLFCSLVVVVFFIPPAARCHALQDDAFQRGLIALKENRLEAALEELTTAEREHPGDARVRNFRGIVLARLGRNADAVTEYREAIRIDPGMEDAYRNLGFLEWMQHHLTSARDSLERAVEVAPEDSFAHYYLGRVLLDQQLYARAFQELDRSRGEWPPDAAFLIQAATGYIALGRQENARKALDDLAPLALSDAQSLQADLLLLAVHENDRAIDLFRKLSKRQSPAPAPWVQFDLAMTYFFAGRYEEAAAQANSFVEKSPPAVSDTAEAASAWSLMGIAYAHLGQGDRAVRAFRQAAALDPAQEEHWLNLTRELMELENYSDAISTVREALTANPKSYALHLRLGAANLSAGRYAEAESAFRDLVAAGDPLPTGYVGLAQVLMRTGRAEEAAVELAAAGQKLGANFLIAYFQGLALNRAGKQADALPAFQEAVRLNANSTEAHFGLGKTQLALGRVGEATAELEKALRLSPGNVQARRLLSQAYRRAGDMKNAAKYAEERMEAPPAAEGDLVGDFLLPRWQEPPQQATP